MIRTYAPELEILNILDWPQAMSSGYDLQWGDES